jgi:hypothetical protein
MAGAICSPSWDSAPMGTWGKKIFCLIADPHNLPLDFYQKYITMKLVTSKTKE